MISIELLRQYATEETLGQWLNDTEFPDNMPIESVIAGLLDTYELAQAKYNEGKATGEKIGFVTGTALSNPRFGNNLSEYSLQKQYTIRAKVYTRLFEVQPLTQ
jgi:hypothetical protein